MANVSAETLKTELILTLSKTFDLPVKEQQQLVETVFQSFHKKFESRVSSQDKNSFLKREKNEKEKK